MALLPMYDFERPFRMLDRELYNPEKFFSSSALNPLVPRDFFRPMRYNSWDDVFRPWQDIMKPMEDLSAAMNRLAFNELGQISSDDEKFQVNVDVQHFSPEEVSVKVVDGYVVVQGNHEEKQDQHGYVSRQFVRRYALPQGCLPDTVESKLSSDGVLTVTAPKVLAMPSTGERIVPVKHTGPVQKRLSQKASSEEYRA